MPCYDDTRGTPLGGDALLTVLSEAFFNWNGNMNDTKRALNASVSPDLLNSSGMRLVPHAFYPESAAHLSQSDFNILFPWLTSKVFKTKDPERLLKLNVRAILQLLRINNVEVAPIQKAELERDGIKGLEDSGSDSEQDIKQMSEKSLSWSLDARILDPNGGIPGWRSISMDSPEALHAEEDYKAPSALLDEAHALEFVGEEAEP
jgi:platelet-activating factor acetylhydrolase